MKVLFINTIDNVGGAALVTRNLMDNLKKMGVECKLLVGYKRSKEKEVVATNKLFGANVDFFINNGINKVLSNDIDRGASQEIFDHQWYKEAEIVHLNNLHGGFFKLNNLIRMSKEKKLIWTFHDEWPIMAHGACVLNNKIEKGFYIRDGLETYPSMLFDNKNYLIKEKKRIYNNSDFVITVPSLWIKGLVKKSLLKNRAIELIYNGIDSSCFGVKDKEVARRRLRLPLNKKIILFVADGGIKNKWKGWQYLEKTMSDGWNEKWLVVVVGGGKSETVLKNIKSIGYVSNKKVLADYYSSADLLIMPSIVESSGNVAIEAMACGTPVVAFPVGVVPEIIKHRTNGYVAKYKNSGDLKKGISWILKNRHKINLKKMSTEIKQRFSCQVSTKKFLNVYQNILRNE